jgi:Transcriptional regulatory protein, C terminal
MLVERSEHVVTKDELTKEVWPNSFVEEANLTQHISMARKALGETPQDHRYIVTFPGQGYRFAGDVRIVSRNGTDRVLENHFSSPNEIEQMDEFPARSTPEAARRLMGGESSATTILIPRSREAAPSGGLRCPWYSRYSLPSAHSGLSRTAQQLSQRKTRFYLPILRTRPETRFLTARCGKDFPYNWSSRLSRALLLINRSNRR